MIVSLKNFNKKKLYIFSLVALSIVCVVVFLIISNTNKNNAFAVSPQGIYSLSAKDKNERLDFLSQFGWQAEDNEIEICDIIIPNSFNKTFEDYNKLQQQQGLDLSKYMGKTCQRFTYKITNYPNNITDVYADLLILDNTVIGGDVCSCEMGGFIHSFYPPNNEELSVETSAKSTLVYPVEKSTANRLSTDQNMPNAPID